MWISILILFITHLLLPAYLLYTLWRADESSKFAWLLRALPVGLFATYLFIAGRWDWFSVYLRYVPVVLFVVAALVSYRKVRDAPFFAASAANGRNRLSRYGWQLLELLLFTGILAYTISGLFYTEEPTRLALPLKDGRYYVGQGGGNRLLNQHSSNEAQQYALDITEVNALGIRANGIYPTDLQTYHIFGAMVYSPCDGTIVAAVDGLPDNNPPQRDSENLAGNHVIIACEGATVLLAHLQKGSLQVEAGMAVAIGQPLGRVGNSGNTTEPHLHIHAVSAASGDVMTGVGRPLLLQDKFPVRNTIFTP